MGHPSTRGARSAARHGCSTYTATFDTASHARSSRQRAPGQPAGGVTLCTCAECDVGHSQCSEPGAPDSALPRVVEPLGVKGCTPTHTSRIGHTGHSLCVLAHLSTTVITLALVPYPAHPPGQRRRMLIPCRSIHLVVHVPSHASGMPWSSHAGWPSHDPGDLVARAHLCGPPL